MALPCRAPRHPGAAHGKFSRGLGKLSAVEWLPPAEQPDASIRWCSRPGVLYHFHGGTMTRRSQGLNEIYPEALIEINPPTPAPGHPGRRHGYRSLAAWLGDGQGGGGRPPDKGVVYDLPPAEAAANLLTIAALDPIARSEFKACAVRVERADPGGRRLLIRGLRHQRRSTAPAHNAGRRVSTSAHTRTAPFRGAPGARLVNE